MCVLVHVVRAGGCCERYASQAARLRVVHCVERVPCNYSKQVCSNESHPHPRPESQSHAASICRPERVLVNQLSTIELNQLAQNDSREGCTSVVEAPALAPGDLQKAPFQIPHLLSKVEFNQTGSGQTGRKAQVVERTSREKSTAVFSFLPSASHGYPCSPQRHAGRKRPFFECFPYACPEPVLVK